MKELRSNIGTEQLTKHVVKQQAILFAVLSVVAVSFYFLAIFNIEYNASTFFGTYYWAFIGPLLLAFAGYSVFGIDCAKKGKKCWCTYFADRSIRYGFLLKQLVIRDFKTKYKRSILGILWSFLNPLMMMGVQYLIFSTIFDNSTIEKYPVYLLIGVVFFSLVSEASNMGLTSITGNANLIKKVYVPKYIYPISRTISSMINLGFSLIPLIIIMLVCGVYPSPYHILFIFIIILLYFFVQGLVLFLSAVMVFFRDTQFIWSILLLVWMYSTPIFYSIESLQNVSIRYLLRLNPLIHYLDASRAVLITGMPPALKLFGYCIICSLAMFTIGAVVFRLTQRKFVLHV